MDGAWPDVLGRIAASGLYDKYTGGKGKGKERGANHCLVNEYLPGQGIMPHTDGPSYHPCTTTLSLGSHTVLCLRSKPSHLDPSSSTAPSEVQKIDIFLPPRSLVVLSGELYSSWLHGIQPLKGDSATSLVGCANWDDWWMWQADQATAEAEAAGDGGEMDGTAAAVSTSLSPEAARADVVNRRRMAEEGAGWEREKRISLTCRRVAGKVRKNVLGLR
ncbi:hypothetical protein Rhopal_006921-T1 [Rhodotorula paludigena]|uniref:Fe2OG dioxygenase domain-containing protein n=1 Tax=Rhodotorula paludigena TaxID=86838 RepID=A0AAV5GXU5_9BASI|nr:hypothetical protein Rhopal_006921-T1 [Rhodotorula paludigena]